MKTDMIKWTILNGLVVLIMMKMVVNIFLILKSNLNREEGISLSAKNSKLCKNEIQYNWELSNPDEIVISLHI